MKPLFCIVCSDECSNNNHGTVDEPICDICKDELDETEDEDNS